MAVGLGKRILIVDFNGTAPLYSYYINNGFIESGCQSKIIGKRRIEYFVSPPKKNLYVGVNTGVKFLDYIINWLVLLKNAKKYDVIVVQWLQSLKISIAEVHLYNILQKLNKKTYYLVHNVYPHNNINCKVRERYDKLYFSAKNLLVHSSDTKKMFHAKHGFNKNIVAIEHGYFYHDIKIDGKNKGFSSKVLITGHISPYKGIEDAVKAISILKKRGRDLELIVKGKGNLDYVAELKEKIKKYGVSDRVQLECSFIQTKDLIELYQNACCSVLPYKKIQQSGVVFSSLGLNVPVICYNVGAFSVVIKERKNGRLVEPDNVDKLADAILWAFENQERLKKDILETNKVDFWSNSAKQILANSKNLGF